MKPEDEKLVGVYAMIGGFIELESVNDYNFYDDLVDFIESRGHTAYIKMLFNRELPEDMKDAKEFADALEEELK